MSIKHDGDKLRRFLLSEDANFTEIAEKLGIARRTLYQLFEKESLDDYYVQKINAIYKCDFHKMFFKRYDAPPIVKQHPSSKRPILQATLSVSDKTGELKELTHPNVEKREGESRIPFYDTFVSAGIIKKYADQTISPSYFITIPHFIDCNLAIKVSGDSMYPKYRNGDVVVCKFIKGKNVIFHGEPYVIVTDDYCVVKYITEHPSKEDSVMLLSANEDPKYKPVTLKKKEILQLYLIRGKVELS